ncbi:MAG: hypothetical protein CEN90_36 [Parcubacteria group bacterium Licking1014_17]|nr:MAG: hypothetical protein CEN90_36 [Parcubacteria group bacterium Licking1014_17]
MNSIVFIQIFALVIIGILIFRIFYYRREVRKLRAEMSELAEEIGKIANEIRGIPAE